MNFIDLTSTENQTGVQIFSTAFLQHANKFRKQGIWSLNHRILATRSTPHYKHIEIPFFSDEARVNFVFQLHFFNDKSQDLSIRIKLRFCLQEKTQLLQYVDCYLKQIYQMINDLNRSQSFLNAGLSIHYLNKTYEIYWGYNHNLAYSNKPIKKLVQYVFNKLQDIYTIKFKVSKWFHKNIKVDRDCQLYRQKKEKLDKIKKQSQVLKTLSDLQTVQKQSKIKQISGSKKRSSNLINSPKYIRNQIQKQQLSIPNFNSNSLIICRGINILKKKQEIQITKSINSKLSMLRLKYQIIDTIMNNRENGTNQGNIGNISSQINLKPFQSDICKKQALNDSNGKQEIQNQKITLKIISSQKNPFVAKYYLDIFKEQHLYMDYYKKNLEQYLKDFKRQITIVDIVLVLEQIFEAQGFFYNYEIIHGDLKLQNFMMNQEKGCIKMIDLGSSSESLPPKNRINKNRNQKFRKKTFCTESYYRKFQDIDSKLQKKYKIKQNYQKHEKFDMYSIGKIVEILNEEYINNPNLNMIGKSGQIQKQINNLVFQLKKDDIQSRITWKQGLRIVQYLKKLIGFQQTED